MEQFNEAGIFSMNDPLERYVFKVAIRYIDQLEPGMQDNLIELLRSISDSSEARKDSPETTNYRG